VIVVLRLVMAAVEMMARAVGVMIQQVLAQVVMPWCAWHGR
jgi:hypothetical protein